MVAAKEIVNARAMADPDPAAVFLASNRRLYEIKRRMFVSLSYFLLDPKALAMTYAFARPADAAPRPAGLGERGRDPVPGLPPAARGLPRHRLRRDVPVPVPGGPPALLHGRPERGDVGRNDTLRGRTAQGVARPPLPAGPCPDLADELLEDVRQYTHGAEQYDDITFVLMRVT